MWVLKPLQEQQVNLLAESTLPTLSPSIFFLKLKREGFAFSLTRENLILFCFFVLEVTHNKRELQWLGTYSRVDLTVSELCRVIGQHNPLGPCSLWRLVVPPPV